MTNIAVVIPARYQSSRYPGKPLAPLRGASGEAKPLIQRSWEAAVQLAGPDSTWIATDDERIADVGRQIGAQVVMTSERCRNGTERCAEAIDRIGTPVDLVINVQGDAPLVPHTVLAGLADRMSGAPDIGIATPSIPLQAQELDRFIALEKQGRAGGTAVVTDRRGRALYFSKKLIPYIPADWPADDCPVRLHLGIYGYRPDALRQYAAAPPCKLEQLEGLEQLRFLDIGVPVTMVEFDRLPWDCVELNNPEDVPVIEAILAEHGID